MKKALVFLLAVALVVGGFFFRAKKEKERPGDSYIGTASVMLYREATALSGRISSRCYLDTQEIYDQPAIDTFTDTMPRFTQSAAEFTTTAATTTATTVTTTTAGSTESTTAGETTTGMPRDAVISELQLKYVGELLHDPTYTIYDKDYKVVVDPRSTLRLPTEPGVYYVKSQATWGKKKNYVVTDYYFIIEIVP